MTTPAIDIIVPAFNAEATLADTLRSVIAQTDARWRCIVVDDGSTDATTAVARSFSDPRFQLISQANRGLSGARNRGWSASSAPLVAFLDADDTIDPRYVERMTRAIGDADLVACGFEMIGPQLEPLAWRVTPAAADTLPDRLLEHNAFPVTSVLLRRSAPARLGALLDDDTLFDESLRCNEDWDLWLRLATRGARWAPVIADTLFRYRLTPGSMSTAFESMHRVGLEVIARAGASDADTARARRQLALRYAGRAIAHAQHPLATELLSTVAPLTAADIGPLVASTVWAIGQRSLVAPGTLSASAADAIIAPLRAFVATTLGVHLASRFLALLTDRLTGWHALARAASDAAQDHDRLVIYGLGRNGRALLAALAALDAPSGPSSARPPIAWIDDHPGTSLPPECAPPHARPERITLADVTPRDLVLVTPEDAAPILARLVGVRHAITLASLSGAASRRAG